MDSIAMKHRTEQIAGALAMCPQATNLLAALRGKAQGTGVSVAGQGAAFARTTDGLGAVRIDDTNFGVFTVPSTGYVYPHLGDPPV